MDIRDSAGIYNDSMGIYICWDVKYGRIENCDFSFNGDTGLDIGHGDTDNLIAGNRLCSNKYLGIHVRTETEELAPHRTYIGDNEISDNGTGVEPSAGIRIDGEVSDITVINNKIGNRRTMNTLVGISVGGDVKNLKLENNEFFNIKEEIEW